MTANTSYVVIRKSGLTDRWGEHKWPIAHRVTSILLEPGFHLQFANAVCHKPGKC